jgi:hypothetical protein
MHASFEFLRQNPYVLLFFCRPHGGVCRQVFGQRLRAGDGRREYLPRWWGKAVQRDSTSVSGTTF